MASWIKMRTNLQDDPRVRWMAKHLKCHPVSIVGMLHSLWSLADEHTTDGRLFAYDSDDINRRVGHTGFAGAVSSVEVGWLEVGPNYIRIPRFDEHNGESAKKRAQTAKRVQRHKQKVTHDALADKNREDKKNSPNGESPGKAGGGVVGKSDTPQKERKQPAGPHHELIRDFCEGWKAKYQAKYDFRDERDGKHVKMLLGTVEGDLNAARKVVKKYLADEDQFLVTERHPISLILSRVNKYQAVPVVAAGTLSAPTKRDT